MRLSRILFLKLQALKNEKYIIFSILYSIEFTDIFIFFYNYY